MHPIYGCEFCKIHDSKENIEQHEKVCVLNPSTKSCPTCSNCITTDTEISCKAEVDTEGLWSSINWDFKRSFISNCDRYVNGKMTNLRAV